MIIIIGDRANSSIKRTIFQWISSSKTSQIIITINSGTEGPLVESYTIPTISKTTDPTEKILSKQLILGDEFRISSNTCQLNTFKYCYLRSQVNP